jgi:hypothetical protein
VGGTLHGVIRLCGHSGEGGWQWQMAAWPPMSGCAAPGDRARAVLLASDARSGGGSCNRVGAARRGEAVAAVQP